MTSNQEEQLRSLAKPTVFNRIERLFVPSELKNSYDPVEIKKGIQREIRNVRKAYGISPRLTGSMNDGLNLPDSVDIDLFSDIQDKQSYLDAIERLKASKDFLPSPYNKPGDSFAVFSRKTPGTSGFPVDLGIAYGDPGREYSEALGKIRKDVGKLDPGLKAAILAKKQLLRDTPFFGKTRYKRFKRELRDTMGAPTMRREKLSYIVNLEDPTEKNKLLKFLRRKDLVGHRTTAGKQVIESGGVLPASELYRKGLLKDIELGKKGVRQDVSSLSPEKIQKHLKNTVYATRGGLLKDPAYGDTGFVAISRTAKPSPFLNLIRDEAVVPPRKSGAPRKLSIGSGYVFASPERLAEYEKLNPRLKYVSEEILTPRLIKLLYKPSTRSVKEVATRIIPSIVKGELKIHPLGGKVPPGYGEK